jgi:hypothetical protein
MTDSLYITKEYAEDLECMERMYEETINSLLEEDMSPRAKKEEVPDSIIAHVEEPKTNPTPTSPEWNEFVLSQLTEEEFSEKDGKRYPTTDGLRRMVDVLCNETVSIDTRIIQAPGNHNGMVAACECYVTALGKVVREVADASPENTDFPYSKFLTAIAGTRAEGRALRKFLRLRKVVTAEEVGSQSVDTTERMNPTQLNILKTLGERYNVNVWKFVTSLLAEREPNKVYNYLNEVQKDFVIERILPELNKFQGKDKDGNMVQVPEDLKGYDSNFVVERWKS